MTTIQAGYGRHEHDHFRPETDHDPATQRRIRGQLEQIDYVAYACNVEAIARIVGRRSCAEFQALAVAAATARARWVAEALAVTAADADRTARLAALRGAYEELREAYEAARRMVERGYLAYDMQAVS